MVETIRLESGHTVTGIGGSNPSLSARFIETRINTGLVIIVLLCILVYIPFP